MKKISLRLLSIALGLIVLTFSNCSNDEPEPATYSVGGTVSGASGSLVLVNNGEELTIDGDGSFTFPTKVADGSTYNVTVKSAPAGQICEVTSGSGTISGANVTNVGVACEDLPAGTFTVGGTVTGLTGTLVITNNGVDELTITADGGFTFGTPLADGSGYEVEIVSQPSGELCTIANGAGTIDGASVTDVAITCEAVPAVGDGKYFAVNNADPAIFYQFQSDLSLQAKSVNGMDGFVNVVGLAYDADGDILYGYSTAPNAILSINRTTGEATKIADLEKLVYDLAYDKNNDLLYTTGTLGDLLSIDTNTGDISLIGESLSLVGVVGLAYDSNNDILYGARAKDFGGGTIVTIDVGTGVASSVGEYPNEFFAGLAYDTDNNKLFGISGFNAGDLFEISTVDGSLTLAGETGVAGGEGLGLAYADGDDQLLATWGAGNGKLYEVNRADGSTVSIASSGYPFITDLAYRDTDQLVYGLVGEGDVAMLVAYNESNGTTTFKHEVDLEADDVIKAGFTWDASSDLFYFIMGGDLDVLAWRTADGAGGGQSTNTLPDNEVLALAFDNENDILYGINELRVFQIDEDTGLILEETAMDFAESPGAITGLNFDPIKKVLVATTDLGDVYAIDPSTAETSLIVETGKNLTGIIYKGL